MSENRWNEPSFANRVEYRESSTADGRAIAYRRTGSASRPCHVQPVMLIHGLGCSSEYWLPVLWRLPAAVNGFAVDLPGYGRSATDRSMTFDSLASDVASLMQSLDLGTRWTVVGHSMGGSVAYELASKQPQLVNRLVLEANTPDTPHAEARMKRLNALREEGVTDKFVRSNVDAWFARATDAEKDRFVRIAATAGTATWVRSLELIMRGVSIELDTERVSDVTLIHGSGDRNRSRKQFVDAAEHLRASRVEFTNSGHTPHFEEPDRFVRHLTERLVVDSPVHVGTANS